MQLIDHHIANYEILAHSMSKDLIIISTFTAYTCIEL